MIVAYSRPIAMKIYRKLLELRPAWKEKIGVVMTSGNNDPEDWKAIIGSLGSGYHLHLITLPESLDIPKRLPDKSIGP